MSPAGLLRGWTTPEDIAAKVRRRWDDGSLLRDYAEGVALAAIDLPVRGPAASQISDDLDAVRAWIARLDAGRRDDSRYALQWASVGGRQVGRNQVPSRAVVSTYEQVWALLGVTGEVRRFDEVLRLAGSEPAVRQWVVNRPLQALELSDELPRLFAAYAWLDQQRGSGRYLREIDVPGVDTKFAERHRPVLATMLGVSSTSPGFLAGLGLRAKPEFLRLRVAPSLGLPQALTEVAVRVEDVVDLAIAPRAALVIENEITYLSVDVPSDGAVIWGKGFDVDRVGRLPWLAGADVFYWGDLDTHGFAILDRMRAWLPHTRSVLMDRATLVAHRDRWGREDRPTNARLRHLLPDEESLYHDLVTDSLGERVRLEQERIDWSWVRARLITDRADR